MLFVANRERRKKKEVESRHNYKHRRASLNAFTSRVLWLLFPPWVMKDVDSVKHRTRKEGWRRGEDDSSSARQVSGSEAITMTQKTLKIVRSVAAAVKRSVYDSLSLWNLITFHQEHKLLCANVWAERFFQFWVNLWHSKPRYSFSAAEGEFQTERQKIIMRESLREIYDEWELDSRSKFINFWG